MTAGLAPDCFYCERKPQWLVTNLMEARAACGHHVETAKDSDVAAVRRITEADFAEIAEAFEEILHPRGRGGRWIFKGKIWEGAGRLGDRSHITRTEHGEISTDAIAHLRGVKGEVPGAHRNKTGADWQKFVDSVRPGIRDPIFITVDHGDEPKISEGNHRRDAAVEAGLDTVPVEIRYFGHAEREGTVLDRARAGEPEPQAWPEEATAFVGLMRQFLTMRAHTLGDRMKEMRYLGWEDLVLKHGMLFRHGPAESRLEREFHATTAKQCFTNALMAAVTHPELTYVEGFAFNGILPVHHAWVVDKDGRVYDPTWENIEGRDASRDVYIGVPFTTDYVTQTVMGKGTDTLMDEYGEGVSLSEPLPPDVVATGVKGVSVPENLQGPDPQLLAELQGRKLGESVFDPFKHPRGRLGRWIGTLGERERHAVERAVAHPARMVEPGDLLRSEPRGRGGKGRKGLKGKASEWRALVDAARAEGVLPSVELRRQLSDALKRQNGEADDQFLDSWFGRGTGTGSRGLIQTTSGDPGVLFEEQHDRIMRAGAAIDAEVERRSKEAVTALKAAQKEHRDAKREKKEIAKADERLRAEVAVEILQRDFGWYDPETVASLNEPKPWRLSSEQKPYVPVEDAMKRWRTYLREKRKDREAQRGDRARGGDSLLISANQDVALAFYRAEKDARVVEAGERRREAGISVFTAEIDERKARLDLNLARRDAAYELLREVRPMAEPGSLRVESARPGGDLGAEAVLRLADATHWLPKDWVDDSNRAVEERGRPLVADIGSRGRYTREVQLHEGDEPKDLITGSEPSVGGGDAKGVGQGVGVMVHELVHRAEDTRDGIKGAEWVFYTSRVSPGTNRKWEDAVSLRELTGVESYREGEVTRPDDFIEPYSGKEYPGDEMTRPYEILTMGVEDLVTGEHTIMEHDPEYRQFVYGALATL